jgi:hypothetical protein
MPEKLSERIFFHLSKIEKGVLMLLADKHHLSMSAMLRKLIMDAKHEIRDDDFDDFDDD